MTIYLNMKLQWSVRDGLLLVLVAGLNLNQHIYKVLQARATFARPSSVGL